MGLGGTAKKIQKVTRVAEELYKKMNEVMQQMQAMQEDFEQTSSQVDQLEQEIAEQRALLEALAAEQNLDVEEVVAAADGSRVDGAEDDADADDEEETDISVASSRPSAAEDE